MDANDVREGETEEENETLVIVAVDEPPLVLLLVGPIGAIILKSGLLYCSMELRRRSKWQQCKPVVQVVFPTHVTLLDLE